MIFGPSGIMILLGSLSVSKEMYAVSCVANFQICKTIKDSLDRFTC